MREVKNTGCPLLRGNLCSARVRKCTPGKELCQVILRAYITGKYMQRELEYEKMQLEKTGEFAALVRMSKGDITADRNDRAFEFLEKYRKLPPEGNAEMLDYMSTLVEDPEARKFLSRMKSELGAGGA